jgi:hypothetical protein
MFGTLIFGALTIAVAARYAMDPTRRLVPLTLSLGGMTLLCGGLGFVTGLIKSLGVLPRATPDERWVWMVGLGESLVNVAFALALAALATLALVVGTWRRAGARGIAAT